MSKIKWDTRFPVTTVVVSLVHYCCYCYTRAEWWSQTLTTDKQHPCFHVGTSSMAGYTWVASRHMMLPHWILHLPLRTDRGLQVHNSCLASSCLHLTASLLAHRPETNSNQKEICHRSLGYMSQTQRVRLTLLNASVLCSHSPFWLLYSYKLPSWCWSYYPWANLPLHPYGAGSSSLSGPCAVYVSCRHLWHYDWSRLVRSPFITRRSVSQEAQWQSPGSVTFIHLQLDWWVGSVLFIGRKTLFKKEPWLLAHRHHKEFVFSM